MGDCIFCKIIRKEAESELLYEDADMIVIRDIRPKAPVHLLVIPKKHFESLNAATADDALLLGKLMLRAAEQAKVLGIDQSGYKVVNNVGDNGGQIIQHFHLHLVGGEPIRVPV
ncbi:MAG: histidine triad nucleotide-binding protein [Candidatus Kerfeldbacteria bacterium]|nr:histidine triad nucleotide-binding protein [Candidatus Kerfeldbacteria bacterium]